ncbi:MAG: glycosyl hydrolase [Chitinophagia bacterium]|nr:glycosyl hydrolase [Chitinophagia bacterium]
MKKFLTGCLVLFTLAGWSQIKPTSGAERLKSNDLKAQLVAKSTVNNTTFRNIGPSIMSGRVVDIEVNPNQTTEFYVAYASGGVWHTINNGQSFTPIFDSLPSLIIGDIAVNWKEKTIWVGTGEVNSSRSSYAGIGVYKSSNDGKSWEYLGLPESHHIGKIQLHPTDPNTAWVAVLGHLYSENKERGIYKTSDGGKTWKQTLYIDANTGGIDIDIDSKNPNTLYAAMWYKTRSISNFVESGKTSGIFKSTNGGDSWTLVSTPTSGFPNGEGVGRIGVAVYPENPSIVYAIVDNNFQQSASGNNARPVDTSRYVLRDFKDLTKDQFLALDDKKLNAFIRSPRNGLPAKYTAANIKEAVQEGKLAPNCIWDYLFDANTALFETPIIGAEIYRSEDGGATWKKTHEKPINLYSMAKPYNVYGGLQDNGTWFGSSATKENYDWYDNGHNPYTMINGGDGMQVQVDWRDNKTVYSGSQFGAYSRQNLQTKERKGIRPSRDLGEPALRYNWQTPILLSKHNQDVFYYGTNKFHRSMNKGDSLVTLSADLSTNPTQGDVPFGTATTMSESPLRFGLIYVGTDDGNLHVSKDGGYNFSLINQKLPKGLYVSRVTASAYSESKVYVTLNGYRNDHFGSYIFVSDDYGANWRQIMKDLPLEPVNVITEDNISANVLYVGTDAGVYVSLDGGVTSMGWNNGLPKAVPVHDIVIHPRDNEIILGTHGRSLYVAKLDDLHKQVYAKK